MEKKPYSCCHHCGMPFRREQLCDKTIQCDACNEFTYRNPSPVVALIIPHEGGVLTGRRGIEPRKGIIALPSGAIEHGETWQEAGARKAGKQLSTRIEDPNKHVRLFDVRSVNDGSMIIIYGLVVPGPHLIVDPFEPNEETLERILLFRLFTAELAFPGHEEMIRRFFAL